MLEVILKSSFDLAAILLETVVVLVITFGAAETLYNIARYKIASTPLPGARRGLWVGFARWLILALEFALAADIVRTVIAPTWTDIGQLAAIAAIRTFLGIFLERDISAFELPANEA